MTNSTRTDSSRKSRASTSSSGSKRPPGFGFRENGIRTGSTQKSWAAVGFAPTAQNKELVFRAVDYLDYDPGAAATDTILTYAVSAQQSFMDPLPGSGATSFSKLKNISCWALPKAQNAAIATSTYQVLYATPVTQAASDPTSSTSSIQQACQRATTVNPTFNTKWVQVGYTDFDVVARSANVIPVEGSVDTTVAFQLGIINPDDGLPVLDPVQLMVVSTYAVALPVATTTNIGTVYAGQFGSVPNVSTDAQYGMVSLLKVQDAV